MARPTIAVSMGDPAGIGPELVAKVMADQALMSRCHALVIGMPSALEAACRLIDNDLEVRAISSIDEMKSEEIAQRNWIPVLPPTGLELSPIPRAAISAAAGEVAAASLRTAFDLAMARHVHAVAAAPMNKQSFHLAGYEFYDELQYLADYTGSAEPFLIGAMQNLWTVTVTEHIPFEEIAANITAERVLRSIVRIEGVLRRLGVCDPRIGVAALNPHAGENGLFGRQEIDEIAPAVQSARTQDLRVTGPVPADAIFVRAHAGEFDGVVCMYHDQANIARKLQPSRSGATLFLGLPVDCATTAHGTAFDKAGQGIADPGSMRDAVRAAIDLAGAALVRSDC